MTTPAYGTRTCDHEMRKASLDAFAQSTTRHQMQSDGAGGWMLQGDCTGCGSTLLVAIALARGHVVHGAIGAPALPQCPLHSWCCDEPGHAGDCSMPF